MNDTQDIQATETQRNGEAQRRCAPASCYASLPPVLDACCSKRAFWFDPKDSRAMFVDKREITIKRRDTSSFGDERTLEIAPDVVADFTALPFPDESFWHVVFDPPHMETLGERSYMALQYGRLEGDWRDMLRKGFGECFRVLKPNGTLNFKWNECEISVQEILALTTAKPLYGNRYGKHYRTHWITFLKHNAEVSDGGPLIPESTKARTRRSLH